MSQALREVIPIMHLLEEMKEKKFKIYTTIPRVYCKCFEDNSGALEMARIPKMRPRTKHINQMYHHFRRYVKDGSIKILPIDTTEQTGDIFTKPLPQNQFLKLRRKLTGY